MSTRSTVTFTGPHDPTEASLYIHYDGYPEGVGKAIHEFLDASAQLRDTRFFDPNYLAARFLVWYAERFQRKENKLDWLGIGIVSDPAAWAAAYRYTVACVGDERPVVSCTGSGWDGVLNPSA